jgi:stearoyl-CoA desaturase (delta-9 desaturase)
LDPANPRLSRRWFEFDAGWMYIRLLSAMRLATVK